MSQPKKTHLVYALYDEENDDLAAVSLDYEVLEMQLNMGDFDKKRFEIVEFDIKIV